MINRLKYFQEVHERRTLKFFVFLPDFYEHRSNRCGIHSQSFVILQAPIYIRMSRYTSPAAAVCETLRKSHEILLNTSFNSRLSVTAGGKVGGRGPNGEELDADGNIIKDAWGVALGADGKPIRLGADGKPLGRASVCCVCRRAVIFGPLCQHT